MIPFKKYELVKILDNQSQKLNQQIERYSNDEIMANDLNILANNCYEEFYIEPLSIREEESEKRAIKQEKIKRHAEPFWRDVSGKEYYFIDGFVMSFSFPFSGDKNLFECQASTYTVSGYPDIDIIDGYITFYYEFLQNEIKSEEDKNKLFVRLENDLNSIKKGVSYVNSDVICFNQRLRQTAINTLQTKKQRIEQFYTVSKLFEVPIKKTSFASTHIEIPRKIQPIKKQYKSEPNYYISDAEYSDILLTIKHTGCTFERTPSSLKPLKEEDIRNLLLSSLNGIYQGNATGETFRNMGKTDICIECDNRSAFIAECKMWNGQKEINKAIAQLDSYLTWRDCKTAIIYFVRNKDFLAILDTVKHALYTNDLIKQTKELDRNEFECSYMSNCNPGQNILIRILLFNLYAE